MRLQFMLDTNIAIYVIKNKPQNLMNTFSLCKGQMCISIITLAEMLYGVEKSTRPEHNRTQVEAFCARLEVLPYGLMAVKHYGEIRADLERRGTPIGANDLHIAAHARSEGLTLVSNNTREFTRVAGLSLTNWLDVEKK